MLLGFHALPRDIFFCVFKLSGAQSSVYAFFLAALMHKPSVLRRFATNVKECGSIQTASSHISCVLTRLGISLTQRGTFSFMTLVRVKLYGQNAD